MNLWRLALQSLLFHRRSALGVLLGATVGTAILVGALAVGDSVRYSLRRMAEARIGKTYLVLNGQARFFRQELAAQIADDTGAIVAPVVFMRGTASYQSPTGGDAARVGRVQVVGVDDAFFALGPGAPPAPTTADDAVILNDTLARALSVKVGDEVLLRVDKPSVLSRDAPLSTVEDSTVALRLRVGSVVGDSTFGRFSLEANQVPPYNAFLPIASLQKRIGMEGRANTLLVGPDRRTGVPPDAPKVSAALWKHWSLEDASLKLRDLPGKNAGANKVELRTDRVFLDPPVAEAALSKQMHAQGILTYFVNAMRVGERATPYSTVAALDGAPLPPDMRDDEIIVNDWMAQDTGAKVGDTVTLTYWVAGPMRKLIEKSADFRVRAIVPIAGAADDPALMPDIPGLSDKKDCRDWEPGVPIDLNKLRDKDQAYWDKHKGTPKGFITLKAGQRIWNNRWGNLTLVRYPSGGPETRDAVEACIRQALSPSSLGLFFVPIRASAFAATSPTFDFGALFLGFSLFLIVAALLLTGLLFALGVEQRSEEVGTLMALGFRPRTVRRLLLIEGAAIAAVAGLLGAALGLFYTQAVVRGLGTIWSGAVADAALEFHAEPRTVVIGALAGFLVSLFSVWLVARRQAGTPPRELLNAGSESDLRAGIKPKTGVSTPGLRTALFAGIGAVMALVAGARGGEGAAGAFFASGALLLIAGIGICRFLLARMEGAASQAALSVGGLGARNTARRSGRSLSAVALLACGSFLVVAVGANRHDPAADADKRTSGTGGFALYGESALPVYEDLNAPAGRERFNLDEAAMQGADVLAFRLREGDEASCLNLNRAQSPRLLGVSPTLLKGRGAFAFSGAISGANVADGWELLNRAETGGAIPVIGDTNTVTWSLGKKVGDNLDYRDERGNSRKLRIVGMIGNSVLQGALVMSEDNFISLFPSQGGYGVFLVDAPKERAQAIRTELTRGLEDAGITLTPTADRMAAFNTVEETYLSIFAILGGLGLLLGSVGLGVIVLRNVLERRGELALLRAVGFGRTTLQALVFSEHALLLVLGLVVGVGAALVAVLPALSAPGAGVPVLSLALTLLAVFVSGFVWVAGATALALRGPLLNALRNE